MSRPKLLNYLLITFLILTLMDLIGASVLLSKIGSAGETGYNLTVAKILVVFLLLGNITLFVFLYFSARKIIKDLTESLTKIVQSFETGDFTSQVSLKYAEFLPITYSFEALKKVMDSLLYGINQSAKTIVQITREEKERVEEITPLATQLNSLVEKASSVGSELTEVLASIERSTEEMKMAISEISKNTHETADRGRLVKSAATEMEETVLNLSRSMEEIRNIAETIRGIAEQTNLLALNASIEAARAGEAGKGFAVVANEVKELAKKVSEFTGEIEKIVDRLNDEASTTVEKTRKTKQMVDEVESATQIIAVAIEEQTAVTSAIVDYIMQTKEKSFSFVSEIEDLKKVVNKLLETSEVLKAQSDTLSEIALTNQLIVSLFKLEKKFLTAEELKKLSVKSLINLGIIGYSNWKDNFLSMLIKGEVPRVERDHTKCILGLGMEILREKFKGTQGENILNTFEESHRKLHSLVEKVEREVDLKNRFAVMNFIEKEIFPTFEEVMKHLHDLKEFCDRFGCE